MKNVATCLFDNWILQQSERQGGQVGQTHSLYCGTGTPAESSEHPVICFKVGGESLAD